MRRTLAPPLQLILIAVNFSLVPTIPPKPLMFSRNSVTASLARDVDASCPVTKRPAHPFVPPAPYSAKLDPLSFWFGTEKLWTVLHADGLWSGLPHYTPDDPTFRQKLFFWRAGFNVRSEPRPALTINGRRLDGAGPPLTIPGSALHAAAPPLASDQANASWQSPD